MLDKNKQLCRRIVEEIWNKKNPALIKELYDAKCQIHTPDGELKGPEGLREMYDVYVAAFPNCLIGIDYLIAESDRVVTGYTFTGTHEGQLMDIHPTRKDVTVKGISVCQIAQGKVVEERMMWDTLSLMEQLDAVPVHTHAWK